tara:strand:+ start:160 stop:639 length:480 start_codon:yes stop_codon:yes gene_type:complete
MSNLIANSIRTREIPNDVIYTPLPVAELMISLCDIKPEHRVLDPSKGAGVFYDNLPECEKDWCEITDKFCYIMGNMNLTALRIKRIHDAGFGITKIHFLKISWWFGDSIVIVCEKNKPSIVGSSGESFVCDICGLKCKRGLKTKNKEYGKNECSNINII